MKAALQGLRTNAQGFTRAYSSVYDSDSTAAIVLTES